MTKTWLAACFVLVAHHAWAQTITSVHRSQNPDAQGYFALEIEGSGFGTGPNIVVCDDFDNQTTGGPVDLNRAKIGRWSKTSSYSQVPLVVDYDHGKAIQIRDPSKRGAASIAQIEAVFPEKVSSIFISYSVVVPEGSFFAGSSRDFAFPDASSWKFTWITDTSEGISSTTKFNVCAPTHGGRGSFLLAGNSVNFGWFDVAKSWSWHTKNYMSFGLRPDLAQPQTSPGQLIFQMSGKKDHVLLVNQTDKPIFPLTNTTSFDRVKFPGWFGNGDQSNFNAYYDDIYVATGPNALARVELSDSSDLASSVINLTLCVESWTDTKIIARLSQAALTKIKSPHIRVYDKRNQSAAGPLQ